MPVFWFEDHEIKAEDAETVLSALLRNGFSVKNGCQAGACQSCLLGSSKSLGEAAQRGLDDDLIARGAFLSCQAKAETVTRVSRLADDILPTLPAVVTSMKRVSTDVLLLALDVPNWKPSPGRFIRLTHPNGVTRPYSVATPVWESNSLVQLHVRLIPGGELSDRLVQTKVGDSFTIQGPYGKCYYRSAKGDENILLIGSGTGIAPLYSIATDALERGHRGKINLYFGSATSARAYFREELDELSQKYPNFRASVHVDADAEGSDLIGSPLTAAQLEHPNMDGYKAYLCGHPGLVRAAQKRCYLAGANLSDISADAFEAA